MELVSWVSKSLGVFGRSLKPKLVNPHLLVPKCWSNPLVRSVSWSNFSFAKEKMV